MSGFWMWVTSRVPESALTTSATAEWNWKLLSASRSLWIRTLSVAGALNPACSSMRCAFAASPEAVSESAICLWPAAVPKTSATTAKSSQPKNAFFQLSALQRPARAARFEFMLSPPEELHQQCLRCRRHDYSNEMHEVKFA